MLRILTPSKIIHTNIKRTERHGTRPKTKIQGTCNHQSVRIRIQNKARNSPTITSIDGFNSYLVIVDRVTRYTASLVTAQHKSMVVVDHVASLENKMANHKEGNTHPKVMERNTYIAKIKILESLHLKTIKDPIEAKFNAIPADS